MKDERKTGASILKRAPGILTADFPKAKVVFNTAACMPYTLNSTASEIWGLCESPKNVQTLVKYLCLRYGMNAGKAKRDVAGFMKELKIRGLIY